MNGPILGKIHFNDETSFLIYGWPQKSKLQNITSATYNYRKLSGAIQPIVKRNLIWTYDEFFIDYIVEDFNLERFETQFGLPKTFIGSYPMASENNVPSYVAIHIIKTSLGILKATIYHKTYKEAVDYVRLHGLKCYKCNRDLKRFSNPQRFIDEWKCPKGHYIGISQNIAELIQKEKYLC